MDDPNHLFYIYGGAKKLSTHNLLVLFLVAIILPINISSVFAQTNSNLQNIVVKLELAPSHVDDKNSVYTIGYVNLVNSKGVAVKAPQDILVQLESDDHSIASVPSEVTILKDHNFATFDIQTGNKDGETIISSDFNGKINYANFKLGGSDSSMPDDIRLKINLPTDNMHVNSEMPFSIFLETTDGTIIRAPYDIEISLDYEKSLISTNKDKLTIKKGNYYDWGVITTNEEVGNAFLRGNYDRFDIDTSENIKISSSLPSGLAISIFPSMVGAMVERSLDIFVSLVDSDGLPAVTPEEVKLELFSDSQRVGMKLDETMEEKQIVIKKGEFGYHFRQGKLDLRHDKGEEITIGATAADLGIALGKIFPVEPLSIDHPKALNKTLHLLVQEKLPANTTSILVYQLSAKGNLDREDLQFVCDEKTGECTEEAVGIVVEHPIDLVPNDQFYPIQGYENYISKGLGEKLNVISGKDSLLKIEDAGSVKSASSYGTAIISSGQTTGDVKVAATIKEFGAGVNSTEIIDVYRHKQTKIFSPTGNDKIVLDKNGFFDLFLIAIDSKQRPKILEKETKYILNPVNELLLIEKDHAFAHANFHSDSFNAGSEESILVKATPVGIKAELELESTTQFGTQISSSVEFEMPFDNLDPQSQNEYEGVVQLKDLLGNPSKATKDLRILLDLDGSEIVNVPEDVTIQEGGSYTTFPIMANGEMGETTISANVKGVIGGEAKISTSPSLAKLKIFANGIETPLEVGQPVPLEIFVDDENAESVPGATVTFVAEGATIEPSDTRTSSDGSAIVDLTANKGPNISVKIIAHADGYVDGDQTFDYAVNDNLFGSSVVLGLPDWVLYVGIAAVLGIVAVVFMFLKRPNAELEEEEEYEYEDI